MSEGQERAAAIRRLFADAAGAPLPIVASVFTPYQLLLFERIHALLPERPVLLIDARPEPYRSARLPKVAGTQTHATPLTGAVTDRAQGRLVDTAMQQLHDFADGKPFVFLCASYQRHFNTVAYTRLRRNENARLLLMDDGLSTFLEQGSTRHEAMKNLAREALARLRGLPRRNRLRGHPQGLDLPELAGIILSIDARPAGSQRRPYFLLPRSETLLEGGDPASALFVGQPYSDVYGWQVMDPLIAAMAKDLRSRGFKLLAFKPHHFQSQAEIARYLDHGFVLDNPAVPVEEMIADSQYRTIASINTTALLTVRTLFGDSVQAIAYNPAAFKPAQDKRDIAEVEALFRRAEVEIVELPVSQAAPARAD